METVEIIRTAAMLVAFAVAVSRGRRIWMLADAGAVLLFGLGWLLTPGILLDVMTTGPLDEYHICYGRFFGAMLLGSVVTIYQTRNTGDITVSNTLLYSRVVGISMQLIAVGYAQLYYRDLEKGGWNQEQVWFGLFGGGVWLLGNLYHLVITDQFGCFGERNDNLTAALRTDGFFSLLIGLMDFAFPDLGYSNMGIDPEDVDGVHLHMLRCFAAVMFMSGLVSSWAPVFLKDEDKRSVLLGRMVQNVLLVAIFLFFFPSFWHAGVLGKTVYTVLNTGLLVWGYLSPTGKKTA